MDNAIEAIIFDLGNVLIDFDHRIAAKRVSALTNKNPQEIFNLFFDSGLTALFEEGKIAPEDFFARIREALNLKLDYAGFLPIWNEIFFLTPKNYAVYALAKSLRDNYKTALLSNINILHFKYLKDNFPVFDAFDIVATSFEAGFRKPHPAIYKKLLNDLAIPPQKAFYTDDRVELVESAQKLGIHSVTFQSAEQLKKDLLSNAISLGPKTNAL